MKLELNLMELNSLYLAVSNQLKEAQREAMAYPSDFFKAQCVIAEELVEKVQEALWAECRVVDDARMDIEKESTPKWVSRMNHITDITGNDIELYNQTISRIEDERDYWISESDWERADFCTRRMNELKRRLDTGKKPDRSYWV